MSRATPARTKKAEQSVIRAALRLAKDSQPAGGFGGCRCTTCGLARACAQLQRARRK